MSTVMYNGFPVSTASDLGKEVMKHERPASYRPENNPYPRMMYKAHRNSKGKIACFEDTPLPHAFDPAALNREYDRVQYFDRKCQLEVKTFEDHMEAKNQGWRDHPTEAIEYAETLEKDVSRAAAERAYADSKMSEQAQAEAAEVDASTEFHVPFIPEKNKGGRPRKVA